MYSSTNGNADSEFAAATSMDASLQMGKKYSSKSIGLFTEMPSLCPKKDDNSHPSSRLKSPFLVVYLQDANKALRVKSLGHDIYT